MKMQSHFIKLFAVILDALSYSRPTDEQLVQTQQHLFFC
jgi:hypothetical protein